MTQVGDPYTLTVGSEPVLCTVDAIDGDELLLVAVLTGEVFLAVTLRPTPQVHQRPFQDGWKLRGRSRTPRESRPPGLLPHWGKAGSPPNGE